MIDFKLQQCLNKKHNRLCCYLLTVCKFYDNIKTILEDGGFDVGVYGRKRAYVNTALIVINVLCFLYLELAGSTQSTGFMR